MRTIFPISKDVDLAIFETADRIAKPYAVVKSSEVLTTGQQVWYMGWLGPFRLPAMPANMPKTPGPFMPEIPMVSIGTISAINPTQPDSFEIHIGRPYSLRIAGGPIVYWSPNHRDYEILGVIKRNERDAEKLSIEGKPTQEVVKSGILEGQPCVLAQPSTAKNRILVTHNLDRAYRRLTMVPCARNSPT